MTTLDDPIFAEAATHQSMKRSVHVPRITAQRVFKEPPRASFALIMDFVSGPRHLSITCKLLQAATDGHADSKANAL